MSRKLNKHPYRMEFDHIDPEYPAYSWEKGIKNYQLICGWRCLANLCELTPSDNCKKCDAFVPYRVKDLKAPSKPGDMCEFLIDGEWKVCEFLGKEWWFQASEIGYGKIINGKKNSRTKKAREANSKRGKGSRMANNGEINVRLMPGQPLPGGWVYGMLPSKKRNHGSSSWCNNGAIDKRYNPLHGIPEGFIPGRIGGAGFSIINSQPEEIRKERARVNGSKANLKRNDKNGRFIGDPDSNENPS